MSNFFMPRFEHPHYILLTLVSFALRLFFLVTSSFCIFVILDAVFPEIPFETKKGIAYGVTTVVYVFLVLRGFGGGGGRGDDDDDEPDESPDDPGGVQNTIPVKSEDFRLAA